MGLPNLNSEGSTLPRRGSSLDIAIEEIYGGPQSRENFVVRPGEVRKVCNFPPLKRPKDQDYQVRKKYGLENGRWFSRIGVTMDNLEEYIWRLAKLNGQDFKIRRAGMYASIFYQAAADFGDDGLPFTAANRLLDKPDVKRWKGDGKGDEIFTWHPCNWAYKEILTTTMTTRKEIEKLYEEKYRS